MISQPTVLGIGTACIDISIYVSEDFLSLVSGSKGGAEAILFEEMNRIIALSGQKPLIKTGGSCANVIKSLTALGNRALFVSQMGSNAFGQHFIEAFDYKSALTIVKSSPIPWVLCLITPDGQRTMRYYSNPNQTWLPESLQKEFFSEKKLVHIESYALKNPGLLERAVELAQENHCLISLDLSSYEIVRKHRSHLMTILSQYVDIVFANVDEVHELLGLGPEEGCRKLQELELIAVVMAGEKGCYVGNRDHVLYNPGINAIAVDTTGCGDFFASGFLHGFLQGLPLEICAGFGNRLGSAIVEIQGAELPLEKWEQLNLSS